MHCHPNWCPPTNWVYDPISPFLNDESFAQLSYIILGNVYAVLACAESILPLIASPAINLIYANTVDFFPGCVYVLGMSLDVVLIALFS